MPADHGLVETQEVKSQGGKPSDSEEQSSRVPLVNRRVVGGMGGGEAGRKQSPSATSVRVQ